MNLCGTCKFWGCNDDVGERFRQCMRVKHDECRDTCNEEDPEDYRVDDPERFERHQKTLAEKAVTVDGSGYFAALRCREDFGCVYHEPLSV